MLARCTICLEDFSDDNSPLTTVCGHLYCIDCATFVFANDGATCAVCRKPQTLDSLIRLYPDWNCPGPASGSQPKRRDVGEMGNEVLDACHTVLESGVVTDANMAPVLYRAENLAASISRRDEAHAPGLQYLLLSLTEVFSELRAKLQDNVQSRGAEESAVRAELQREQRVRVVREFRVRREERRSAGLELIRQNAESMAQIHDLEEKLQDLTHELSAERARASADRMTTESLEEEMRQWRTNAIKYKKKYHAKKQEVENIRRPVPGMYIREDSLEVI